MEVDRLCRQSERRRAHREEGRTFVLPACVKCRRHRVVRARRACCRCSTTSAAFRRRRTRPFSTSCCRRMPIPPTLSSTRRRATSLALRTTPALSCERRSRAPCASRHTVCRPTRSYNAHNFLEKNRDPMPETILQLLATSSVRAPRARACVRPPHTARSQSPFVSGLFANLGDGAARAKVCVFVAVVVA